MEIQLASVPDKDNLVAEIWLEKNLLCEISKENDKLEIEFFDLSEKSLDFEDLFNSLKKAKELLVNQS